MLEVPFSEFDGLIEYLQNSQLREVTLKGVGLGEAFVQSASEVIFSQFLLRHRYHDSINADATNRLKKLGYSSREVAVAIASALLDGRDIVKLRQVSAVSRYTSAPYLIAYSASLSLITLLGLLYFGQQFSTKAVMGLLQFEPILAFFGVLFGAVYFWILRRIFR